jgi:hypothetical protein
MVIWNKIHPEWLNEKKSILLAQERRLSLSLPHTCQLQHQFIRQDQQQSSRNIAITSAQKVSTTPNHDYLLE